MRCFTCWLVFFLLFPLLTGSFAFLSVTSCYAYYGDDDDDDDDDSGPSGYFIHLNIESVDASELPTVRVYFRSIDNVPTSAYYDLAANPHALTIKEWPVDGGSESSAAELPVELVQIHEQPFGVVLMVDQSGSVGAVMGKIKQAVQDWIGTLDSTDSHAGLVLFEGDSDLEDLKCLAPTQSLDDVRTFVSNHIDDCGGCTPLYESWRVAAALLNDFDDTRTSLCVLTMTDGMDTSSSVDADTMIDDVTATANSLRAQVNSIGFPLLNDDGLPDNTVRSDEMKKLAHKTGGVFLMPQSPFPQMPDKPSTWTTDTAKVYMSQLVLLARNVLSDDDLQAEWDDFSEPLNYMIDDPSDPFIDSEADFMNIDVNDLSIYQTVAETCGETDLSPEVQKINTACRDAISDQVVDEFYNNQMRRMLNKITHSQRTLYELRYVTNNVTMDGGLRKIKVSVGYTVPDYTNPVTIDGTATAHYVAPLAEREDAEVAMDTELDAGDLLYDFMLSGNAPRDGHWITDMLVNVDVDLKTLDQDGNVVILARGESSETGDDDDGGAVLTVNDACPLAPSDPGEFALYEEQVAMYIDHLYWNCEDPTSDGVIAFTFYPQMPACLVADLDDPQNGSMVDNPFAWGFRKRPIWYVFKPTVLRQYEFSWHRPVIQGTSVSIQNVTETAWVKMKAPALILFPYDDTPPTVAINIMPRRGAIARLECLEVAADSLSATRPKLLKLFGSVWEPTMAVDFDGSRTVSISGNVLAEADWAGMNFGGTAVPGLCVRRGVRHEIKVLARDNLDRTIVGAPCDADHDYLPIQGLDTDNISSAAIAAARSGSFGEFASHNHFEDGDIRRSFEPGEQVFLDVRNWVDWDSRDQDKQGVFIKLVYNGEDRPVGDFIVFNEANMDGNGAPLPDGDHIVLHVEARDQAGNVMEIDIPVYVYPMEYNARAISSSSSVLKSPGAPPAPPPEEE